MLFIFVPSSELADKGASPSEADAGCPAHSARMSPGVAEAGTPETVAKREFATYPLLYGEPLDDEATKERRMVVGVTQAYFSPSPFVSGSACTRVRVPNELLPLLPPNPQCESSSLAPPRQPSHGRVADMALPAWRGMQSAGSARLLRSARLATDEELIKEAQRVAPRTDKPGRSRLFRMSRSVVPASFYSYAGATQLGSARSKYFQLSLRRLSDQIVQDINRGPPWLQGDYPANLLHQRHEKRRLVNITPVSVWRSGEESAEDDARWESERKQLGRLKIPLLERGNPDIDLIPTVIICSKKKIGKLAVTRFAVTRLIWRSFDAAVRRLQDSPEALPNGELAPRSSLGVL